MAVGWQNLEDSAVHPPLGHEDASEHRCIRSISNSKFIEYLGVSDCSSVLFFRFSLRMFDLYVPFTIFVPPHPRIGVRLAHKLYFIQLLYPSVDPGNRLNFMSLNAKSSAYHHRLTSLRDEKRGKGV